MGSIHTTPFCKKRGYNLLMRKSLFWLGVLLILAACQQAGTATPPLGTPVPYATIPPTQTFTFAPVPSLPQVSLPTPTPIIYQVVQGDTLSSIALKNGVTLDALQAANPGVSAASLSVGVRLLVPAGNPASGEASPTPASLSLAQRRCWSEASGGLWCFALFQNPYAETLEDISAQFVLSDLAGRLLASQVVYGYLDILPGGASMPLAAHFAGPLQAEAVLQVQVLTAIRLLPGASRYLPVALENTLVSMEASGLTAAVSGKIRLTTTGTAKTVWILATAYDAAGNVVGVRRWESPAALSGDAPLSFSFPVSSLGPAILRVDLLAEARP